MKKIVAPTVWLAGVALMIAVLACASCKKDKQQNPKGKDARPHATVQKKTDIKNPKAFKDKLMMSLMCPKHRVTLNMDEKKLGGCPYSRSISGTIDHMIRDGWSEKEIHDVVGLLNPLFTPIQDAQACSGENGKIRADFFIMSHCPYGMKFSDQLLPLILQDFADSMEWVPHFIVGLNNGGNLVSMHGDDELQEDRYQICLFRKNGGAPWLKYARCFSQEVDKSATALSSKPQGAQIDWKGLYSKAHATCSASIQGGDAQTISKCMGQESETLLRTDLDLSQRMQAQASPTSVFNCSEQVAGVVDYSMIKPYLCTYLEDKKKPLVCSQN